MYLSSAVYIYFLVYDKIFRFIANGYGNPDELIDIMYEEYPEMLSDDTLTRTMAASELLTDWWFSSAAHYEAARHSRYSTELVVVVAVIVKRCYLFVLCCDVWLLQEYERRRSGTKGKEKEVGIS